MNSEIVKESLRKMSETLSFNYPALGWYFSSEEIENSFVFKKKKWVLGVACMVEGPVKGSESRNRMREILPYGSVGGALGNWCFYPDDWRVADVQS